MTFWRISENFLRNVRVKFAGKERLGCCSQRCGSNIQLDQSPIVMMMMKMMKMHPLCDRFQALDSFLCLFLCFPSMLFFWRGIWDLYGVYIFPNQNPKFEWATTALGLCSIVGYFSLPVLSQWVDRVPCVALRFTVTRLYMYAYGILAMANWRGIWGVADYYLIQFGWKSCAIGLPVCYSSLLVMRSSRTAIFPPFVVALDTRADVLVPSTCFQTKVIWKEPWSVVKYTLDSLFTQYFILTMTVLTWRSSLTLLDIFLLPGDWWKSNVVSFGVGVAGSVVLFALETPLSRLGVFFQNRGKWQRLIYEDLVYVVVFVVESFLWRGAWNLNVLYIIPDPRVGGWVNHCIGIALLMPFQLMSYVSSCGCSLDGIDANASDAIYATKYLRHLSPTLSQWNQRRKIRRILSDERAADRNLHDDDDDDDVIQEEEMTSFPASVFVSTTNQNLDESKT